MIWASTLSTILRVSSNSHTMGILYNIGIHCYTRGIAIASLWNTKARLWWQGRQGIRHTIEQRLADRQERRIWIHVASLGEFEQARPIIEQIKQHDTSLKIVLTFFSPSGYEIRKNYPLADYIFYLPADTSSNAKWFLDAMKPEVAVFIKYEFWLNYLSELRNRAVPTYLVSAIFRADSVFFKHWGAAWRKALSTFHTIFVQDKGSKELLELIDIKSVSIAGDTRFDRVRSIADAAQQIPIIENFCDSNKILVAGSTWAQDEEILLRAINNNPNIKFIIAPHEMDESRIEHIIKGSQGGAIRYTQTTPSSDIRNNQVLILDTIGILSSAYRYATFTYVGGGFGAGIHNTLEPAIFGHPIAFGPRYKRFKEACDMVELGIATSIRNYDDLEQWLSRLSDDNYCRAISLRAKEYSESNCGATELIIKQILNL